MAGEGARRCTYAVAFVVLLTYNEFRGLAYYIPETRFPPPSTRPSAIDSRACAFTTRDLSRRPLPPPSHLISFLIYRPVSRRNRVRITAVHINRHYAGSRPIEDPTRRLRIIWKPVIFNIYCGYYVFIIFFFFYRFSFPGFPA